MAMIGTGTHRTIRVIRESIPANDDTHLVEIARQLRRMRAMAEHNADTVGNDRQT